MSLFRLLQITSTTLPVGAYSYSQGLEWAVESGIIHHEESAQRWIADHLVWTIARFDLPILSQVMDGWQQGDEEGLRLWDERYLASRETAEGRAETLQMAYSLKKWIHDINLPLGISHLNTYLLVWSAVAHYWQIKREMALEAWLWSWCENQTLSAMKSLPLGQASGARILYALGALMPQLLEEVGREKGQVLSNFAPGLMMSSALHETQYSRIFRS